MKTSSPLRPSLSVLPGAPLSSRRTEPLAQPPVPAGALTLETPASPALGHERAALAETLAFDAAVRRAMDRNPTAREASAEITRAHALLGTGARRVLAHPERRRHLHLPDANRLLQRPAAPPARQRRARPHGGSLSVPLVNPRGWVSWDQASEQDDVASLWR